ncbi:hypothetical protein M094_0262 [Bacteroides uniformis str. 3978 T3 ii]|uniref:Uncharacterized protein n=1 Tax=Bacteroides uniformis str. 3978 T3 ii TaxID=1339349 RepID=A0A078S1V6_BACUN|nr:hypothetical protein M094_0262 [Bacteroides uniformis str. 3978 T3 ii]
MTESTHCLHRTSLFKRRTSEGSFGGTGVNGIGPSCAFRSGQRQHNIVI